MSKCKWCDDGMIPAMLDQNGILTSISGEPGTLQHSYEDAFWPCANNLTADDFDKPMNMTRKITKKDLLEIFDPLLENRYEINCDPDIFEVVNELGDIVYSGAMPRNKVFARELFEHLKRAFDIYQERYRRDEQPRL